MHFQGVLVLQLEMACLCFFTFSEMFTVHLFWRTMIFNAFAKLFTVRRMRSTTKILSCVLRKSTHQSSFAVQNFVMRPLPCVFRPLP
jgi:hypothetical protein